MWPRQYGAASPTLPSLGQPLTPSMTGLGGTAERIDHFQIQAQDGLVFWLAQVALHYDADSLTDHG